MWDTPTPVMTPTGVPVAARRRKRESAITDFEYELQLSQTNHVIAPEIDTIFLTTNLKYSYLSSSIVKEIAEYHGDISAFLEPEIAARMIEKLKGKEKQ